MTGIKILLFFFFLVFSIAKMPAWEAEQKIKTILESPIVNLIFIYNYAKINPAEVKRYLGKIEENKQGYFKINTINCDEIIENQSGRFTYCAEDKKDKLPQLYFTQPVLNLFTQNGQQYGARQILYQQAVDQKKIYEFAQPLIRTFSRPIKSISDLRQFIKDFKDIPRVIYLTDKDKLSYYYKALTGNFRHTIAFAHVFSNNTKLCSELNVKSFPTLLLDEKLSLEIHSSLPHQINYLKQFEADEKKTIKILTESSQGEEILQTTQQLENKVLEMPRYSVIHVTDGKPHPAWKGLKKKLLSGFDYFAANQALASELNIRKIPSIVFYHRSIAKKQYTRTNFHQNIPLRDIVSQITNFIDDYSSSIGSLQQMQRQSDQALKERKKVVTLFIDSDEVPVGYKILSGSQQYKGHVQFYRYKNAEPDVLKNFRITKKLPVMVVMYESDQQFGAQEIKEINQKNNNDEDGKQYRLRVGQYDGIMNYDGMKKYVDELVVEVKKKTGDGPQIVEEINEQKNLIQIKSMKHLNRYCIKDSCYMLLVDNNPSFSQSARKAANFIRPITRRIHENVVWADAICHPQLLTLFDIQQDDLPVLVYVNHKFQKYSRLVGRLTAETPLQFIDKIKTNRITYRNYENLFISNKNCQQFYKKIDSIKYASTELTDQQRQILEQIKRQQQGKRMQINAAIKADKKKPKKYVKDIEQDEDDSQL